MSTTSDETGTKVLHSSPAPSSRLSVDAPEFVPSILVPAAAALSSHEGVHKKQGAGEGGGVSPLAEVPCYLTTCYPFVSLPSQQGLKMGMDSSGPGRTLVPTVPAFAAGPMLSRHPCQHLGVFPQQVGFHQHSHPTPTPFPWLAGLQPAPTFTPTMTMTPLTPGVHIPFDGGTGSGMGGGNGGGLLPSPKADGLLPTPRVLPSSPFSRPHVLGSGMMVPSHHLLPVPAASPTPHHANRALGRAGRSQVPSISRGTQRDTYSSTLGPRSHTIIMRDTSIQTDFNKDIANYTLQEKPSMLYRRGQRKNKGNRPLTGTDSEEVDSDSGYSSPLHRRNLVSNGTHPARMDENREGVQVGTKAVIGDMGPTQHSLNSTERAAKTSFTTRQMVPHMPGSGLQPKPTHGLDGRNRAAADRERARTWASAKKTGSREGSSSSSTAPGMAQAGSSVGTAVPSSSNNLFTGSTDLAQMSGSRKDGAGSRSHSPANSSKDSTSKHTYSPANSSKDSTSKHTYSSANSHKDGTSKRSYSPAKSSKDSTGSKDVSNMHIRHAHSPSSSSKSSSSKRSHSPGNHGSSSEVKGQVSHSPSSGQRTAAPSPALLDFPVLKPAKRNEPPWSLTPSGGRGGSQKDGEGGGGFLGMVANSVKSYASIVKSLSGTASQIHSLQTAEASNPISAEESAAVFPSQAHISTGAWGVGHGQQAQSYAHRDALEEGWVRLGADGAGVGEAGISTTEAAAKTESSTDSAFSAQGSGVRKSRAVWVGEEGTVLKGRKTSGAGGGIVPAAAATGVWQGSGGEGGQQQDSVRAEPKHYCDSWERDSMPSALPDHPPLSYAAVAAAQQRPGAGHSVIPEVQHPPLDKEGGNRTDSTHQHSAQSGDEKTDEEGKRRQRRRRRRRRRKGKWVEGEGGSDGMSGMERTVSSSNISRSSDITLHFDDEEEFPDIRGQSTPKEGAQSLLHGVHSPGRDREAVTSSPLSSHQLYGVPLSKPDPLHWMSYSERLKRKPSVNDVRSRTQSAPGSCLSGEEGGEENFNSQPGQGSLEQNALSKRARKRRKRRELASRAADAELAEISLEQQMLRQKVTTTGRSSSRPGSEERARSRSGEKSPARGLITDMAVVNEARSQGQSTPERRIHQPFTLSIAEMLDAFEKRKSVDQKTTGLVGMGVKKGLLPGREDKKCLVPNALDANAPAKRGKERELPKPKKPSPLKKIILKEREEKKRMRLIGDCEGDMYPQVDLGGMTDNNTEGGDSEQEGVKEEDTGNPVGESDLSQDGLSSRSVDTEDGLQGVSPGGADLSPISQTSPISMSPLTPGASPISSPIAGYLSRDPIVLRIHSRRFREYCTQILDKDIDMCCTALLHDLVKFQDRMYHKDPNKAKGKRRVVLGLREVTKHLKLNKIKCVIISPNLEKIQSKGGLDEALNNILNMCQEQNVPFVFALGRRALGRACAKLVPVSVAGIFNYEGCEEKFHQLISLTHKGREAYADMVRAVEREMAENPPPQAVMAHMGHSRTPSGCSAISFTSSVLSEPISENFPHAEPETDSKGYEIVRHSEGSMSGSSSAHAETAASNHNGAEGPPLAEFPLPAMMDDIDDGNEADTEDFMDAPRKGKKGVRFGGCGGEEDRCQHSECTDSEEFFDAVDDLGVKPADTTSPMAGEADVQGEDSQACSEDSSSEGDSQLCGDSTGRATQQHNVQCPPNLPHIDSIHSSLYDMAPDIMSQHSSRTALDNSEALSTHSSRTLGEGSLTTNAEVGRDCPPTPDSCSGRSRVVGPTSTSRLNKERVQSWVESCLHEEKDDNDSDNDNNRAESPDNEDPPCDPEVGDNSVGVRPSLCDGVNGEEKGGGYSRPLTLTGQF